MDLYTSKIRYDYRALFTETAQNITFKADLLADDVELFALYIQHGKTKTQWTRRYTQVHTNQNAPCGTSFA
jgi:hypothetical protein